MHRLRRDRAAGGGVVSQFKPPLPDATYQHSLVRRLWEAQVSDATPEHKRLMAEAAQELEANLPATDEFVDDMRKKHAKVLRSKP